MYTRNGQGGYSTTEEEDTETVDETRVGDAVKVALARRARRKDNERKTRAYLDSVKNRVDPADSIRGALKGSPYLRKRVMKNSFEPDLEERNNPVVAATIKQGEQNVAKDKEAKRAAAHTAMVKKLIAARKNKTRPKKGPSKPHPKSTVRTFNYGAPHDPKYGPGGSHDTLTGNREEVEWDKMTQKEKEAHAE